MFVLAFSVLFAVAVVIQILRNKKSILKNQFRTFLAIAALGFISSLVPFGLMGLTLGFPSVLLAAVLVSFLLDK